MFENFSALSIGVFFAIVIIALVIDLIAHSADKPITIKNAAVWSVIWVMISSGFAAYIWQITDTSTATLFLTGYVLEKALAVDNLFVIMAICTSFGIRDALQHRVLYYGILGAIFLRFFFITIGSSLLYIDEFVANTLGIKNLPFSIDMCVYIFFGLIVLFSAWAMFKHKNAEQDEEVDYTKHRIVKFATKFMPVHHALDGHNFFTLQNGKRMMTPLFLCLMVVEVSDVAFAFDSVPAIIAVTKDPFLVFTSNIFAILGLRSMYFLLLAAKNMLCHLETAVIVILVFIGFKLIIDAIGFVHISPVASLGVIGTILSIGILSSFIFPEAIEDNK